MQEGETKLKCAQCGKEILDEKSSFCAYCGIPFDSKPQNTGLATGAGLLATIAAAFSVAIGAIGVVNYLSYVDYYAAYGYDASTFIGFLFFGIFALIASAFGFAGSALALSGKRVKISVLGTIVMFASVVFTFADVWYYDYGFSEGILLSGISVAALSIASAILVVKSKKEVT
jgi:hypothetical protein